MNCPFPGMDPYLESQGFWPDFHATLVNYLRESVAGTLPKNYHASIGERVSLVEREEYRDLVKRVVPDVAVTRDDSAGESRSATATLAPVEPIAIQHVLDIQEEIRETYIEISRREDQSLVTVIELLSPTNKCEPGYSQYMEKHIRLLREDVHLLELDLLLAGTRLPLQSPLPPGDCYAMLSRANNRPWCEVYAWSLRAQLPVLPIPLRAPDADITVSLADVFKTAYERGRYADVVDYTAKPQLPTDAETLKWVSAQTHAEK
jgi:hypothetical protein